MKHPIYTALAILSCSYLTLANTRGWNFLQSSANRSALSSTSYRYRPAINTSSGGGWFSGGSGFHK
jgi:hypothetical protein